MLEIKIKSWLQILLSPPSVALISMMAMFIKTISLALDKEGQRNIQFCVMKHLRAHRN